MEVYCCFLLHVHYLWAGICAMFSTVQEQSEREAPNDNIAITVQEGKNAAYNNLQAKSSTFRQHYIQHFHSYFIY